MALVSISGPPRSGKTTLWNDLQAVLGQQGAFHCDLPREALNSLGYELAEDELEAFQHYIGYSARASASRAAEHTDLVFADKSVVDAVAYWDVLIGAPRPRWAELSGIAPAVVVVCEHNEIKSVPDQLQQPHEQLRDRIVQRITKIAAETCPVVFRACGDPQNRLALTLRKLRDCGLIS